MITFFSALHDDKLLGREVSALLLANSSSSLGHNDHTTPTQD